MSGPAVAVEGLSLTLGAFALRDVSLAVETGEILVLLGPNGAGKSVTIETIAGFHRPTAGRIAINGREVIGLPPEQRHVGLVFQNFGLFPHLSVARNVAIGRRRPGAPFRGDSRVPLGDPSALLDYFAIAHLADRKPGELSTGERQRTSLARALATRPDLLLFDEPFSALDALTHEQLRHDLDHFVREAGIPAIFVTHDHIDARVLANRIAVIKDGTIVQQGTTAEVFERPRNAFVAAFVGFENVLTGEVVDRDGDGIRVAIGSRVICSRTAGSLERGRRVVACIRAEDVKLHLGVPRPKDHASGTNQLEGRIVAITNLGPLTKVSLDCGFELCAYVMSGQLRDAGFAVGADAQAAIDATAVHVMPEL